MGDHVVTVGIWGLYARLAKLKMLRLGKSIFGN